MTEEKKNPQDDQFERDDEVDLFNKIEKRESVESPEIFKKIKRDSQDNKMNPFSLAKIFNPSLDDMDNIENLCYDEKEARTSHEAPKREEINEFQRRQTKLFKDLKHVEYDENSCGYNRIRQSVLDKSLSRGKMSCLHNQLSGFAHNPDLMAKTSINMDLMVIPEQSNSAPPKSGCEVIPEESERNREKLL